MRATTSLVLWLAVSGSAYALATIEVVNQETTPAVRSRETPEEVIVRGRQIGELRAVVQQAREHAYAIFNEINSDDDFDVRCRDERKYHSRATRRVCRAQFEDRISAAAASEYMRTLTWVCPTGDDGAPNTQDCMFSGYGQRAADRAKAVEGQAPGMRDRMNDEILRLANQDDRFAQAILEFYEADRRYAEARRRGDAKPSAD
jgi:hypothetical protein